MPLLLRRERCCKCGSGCTGITDDPASSVGTHDSSNLCCETGGNANATASCSASTSCCQFNQTADGKTALTIDVPTFGELVFDDAAVMICGVSAPGCPYSLAVRTTIRAAMIVGGNVIEVYLEILSRVVLQGVATLDCGPWNSDWNENCTSGYFLHWSGSHDGGTVGVSHEATITVTEYSGSTVIKSSEAICSTGEVRTYCARSGGSVETSYSGSGLDVIVDAAANLIPASGTAYDRYCVGSVLHTDALFTWSMTPAPTLTELNTRSNTYPC